MNRDTLLHRQVHPSWVQNDVVSVQVFTQEMQVSSLAFTPSTKDENKLSVYNGEKFTAEQSFNHYVANHTSFGVLSVTKGECESVDLLSVTEDNFPFNGHSYIDFTSVESKNQKKIRGQKLKSLAVSRGWTHRRR
ncbi:hypothetical protein [Spirosoma sordidisoli]|uniref:Uncharacterized protein n=1 Tax=Spirosoma sordidisoli TaxID=2502893 RepID=A0A4Q2UKV3_9BACT|nr:hypothetical protein [Spirosoma sordidisoli]RYC70187.1 hypothetical protein EQG79_09985 [Spirosoma sordidisoli]